MGGPMRPDEYQALLGTFKRLAGDEPKEIGGLDLAACLLADLPAERVQQALVGLPTTRGNSKRSLSPETRTTPFLVRQTPELPWF
jgi:hypothetical protein